MIRNEVPREHSVDDDDAPSIDIREYWGLLLRHRWLLIAGTMAGIVLGVLYARSRPVSFSASASVLIDSQAPQVLGRNVDQAVEYGTHNWSADSASFYNSQLTIMRSEAVARLSVEQGELHLVPEISGIGDEVSRKRNALSAVRMAVSVSLADEDRTVWVTAIHKSPIAAAAIANAVVGGYQEFNVSRYQKGNKQATAWLATELDEVEQELADTDRKISDFKKDNELLAFSIEDRRSLLGRKLAHYSDQASAAKTARISSELALKKISGSKSGDITTSSIFDLTRSPTGRLLREKYVAATIDLQSLAASLGPLHPTRVEQAERVAKLRLALVSEADVVVATAQSKHKESVALEARMSQEVQKLKTLAFELGPQEIAHSALVRKRKDAAARAVHLRDRYNENNMAGRVQTTNVRPLDQAQVPLHSGAKRWTSYAIASSLLGLMMSLGLILLIHQLDSRIQRVSQVEELAGSAFLGALPMMDKPSTIMGPEVARFQEAIRIVRTNLHFLAPDVVQKTIMVTSPQPQDGKSTTAYWLAASLSQLGKKVLLIDADMRSPSLHTMVGIHRNDGLSDLIIGDISKGEAVRETDFAGVHLLPAGRPIRDPAESLMSDRFKKLLASFQDEYDLVVIDTPPVLPVADASLLSRNVDVALVVGRCAKTEKSALKMALEQLRRAKPKALGVLANGADVRAERYYYKGYDGYQYGEVADFGLDVVAGNASQS